MIHCAKHPSWLRFLPFVPIPAFVVGLGQDQPHRIIGGGGWLRTLPATHRLGPDQVQPNGHIIRGESNVGERKPRKLSKLKASCEHWRRMQKEGNFQTETISASTEPFFIKRRPDEEGRKKTSISSNSERSRLTPLNWHCVVILPSPPRKLSPDYFGRTRTP